MDKKMSFDLQVWRQPSSYSPGSFVRYRLDNVMPEMSFLEMLDMLNEKLVKQDEEPVAFESDCREGICGNCGLVINGVAHGPKPACTTCELRMREFMDASRIVIEPFRANGFPVVKDLVVDRSAFDRIIAEGGYVSVNTGSAPDANLTPIPKEVADKAMDAATCIGCGACVAACPNASASLFTSAKISQYAFLPQGSVERTRRVLQMTKQMDLEGFGDCSNHAECEAVCPKTISVAHIALMRREYVRALKQL